MGKIKAGILSPVSGKIGGVVGGKWKDQAYLRSFVIPANPRSADQTIQRNLFGKCVDFAKPIVGPVFNVYTDKFQPKMSGFNFFVKRNIKIFTASPVYANVKVTEGKLFLEAGAAASFGTSPGQVLVEFNPGLGNNGRETDKIYAVGYNVTKNIWGFPSAPVTRQTQEIDVNIPWVSSDTIHIYLLAAQYNDGILALISNSQYMLAVYSV